MVDKQGRKRGKKHRVAAGGVALAGAALLSMTAAFAGASGATVPTARSAAGGDSLRPRPAVRTVVHVDARAVRGTASRLLLGINHHYNWNGFALWDPAIDKARPEVVAEARRAGVTTMRFPGGSVAIPYDWRRAIGPHRGCQIDGNHPGKTGIHHAQTTRLHFGPDEYMVALRQLHARPLIMVPSMISTPAAAADWVEYMNAPARTAANPHGGVDWAEVRAANGHAAPYRIRTWEVGNEPMHIRSRYWMSSRDQVAVRQYAFGGNARIRGEYLGQSCAHPRLGVPSDGSAGQVFEALYPPVKPGSMALTVGSGSWTEVANLADSGPKAHVYALDPVSGRATFGDGVHGAIPRSGAHVRASYTSVHQGFFDFARAMKEVDPRIQVCASWGRPLFTAAVRGHHYDCLTDHPVTSYRARSWTGPREGHDLMMLAADRRIGGVARLKDSMPARVPLLLTEFAVLKGDWTAFPTWASSASQAVYMSTEWAGWLKQHISVGTGGNLLWTTNHAAFGHPFSFTYSAEAYTRQAIKPMFNGGGRVLGTYVSHNPVRTALRPAHGHYSALVVTATRTPTGDVLVMVVNRLPTTAVRARVAVSGRAVRRSATFRTVSGPSFTSANPDGRRPTVTLHIFTVRAGSQGLVHRFPPASTTLIRLRPAR